MSGVREPTHAGSWYPSSATQLRAQLSSNLSKVHALPDLGYAPPVADAKAVIAPHAGYSYSGPAAAWAYAAVPTARIKRVFLLGPSHHAHISGIALSPFASYGTPLGDIPLDLSTIDELRQTGLFQSMRPAVDEDEHSLEMHLPYLRLIFDGRDDLGLVPLLVGHPDRAQASKVSAVLARYWADDETFFVISSDFCHWGSRFSCTPYYPDAPEPLHPVPPVPPPAGGVPAHEAPPTLVRRFEKAGAAPIWKSIQYMDHEGMDLLRWPAGEGALEKWEAYLARSKNTICGRNPISVLVALIQHVYSGAPEEKQPHLVFVRYEQSSRCESARDSSVSYVSGVLRVPQ